MSERWNRASLKLRIKAVQREVVVRYVIADGGDVAAAKRCASPLRMRIMGRKLPADLVKALDAVGSIYGPPSARTILEWVHRYRADGLSGLLERHGGWK